MNTARLLCAALAVTMGLGTAPLSAMDRVTLGWGRLFNNDAIGDGRDRWHSGGYALSRVRGVQWTGALPSQFGEILETRIRSEIITAANLASPAAPPADRRYAGVLSVGMHTHFQHAGFETSLGVDLVGTGPMTGVGRFQTAIHNAFGMTTPGGLNNQIPNRIYPTVTAEIGRRVHLSDTVVLRPFAEASAGVETFVRVGADVTIGLGGLDDMMLRDVTTGQRYRGISGGTGGVAFSFGGDVAKVAQSAYLPASDGYVLTDARLRLRAGLGWQGEKAEAFYGVTWMGREFTNQTSGQVVGSLRLKVRF